MSISILVKPRENDDASDWYNNHGVYLYAESVFKTLLKPMDTGLGFGFNRTVLKLSFVEVGLELIGIKHDFEVNDKTVLIAVARKLN